MILNSSNGYIFEIASQCNMNLIQFLVGGITLNPAKRKHLRTGRCREDYTYYSNASAMEQVNSTCDIGVFVQYNLKFATPCNSLAKKPSFCSQNIRNAFKGQDRIFIFFCIILMSDQS